MKKSTSIYYGILCLVHLAASLGDKHYKIFLVAPNLREREIIAQLKRPSFSNIDWVSLRYILFSSLYENCSALGKFGDDYKILFKIANEVGTCI